MLKTAVFVGFIVFSFTFSAVSQEKQTDLQFLGIKGKVKSVQESSLSLVFNGKPIQSPKRSFGNLRSYDVAGNVMEEVDDLLGIKLVYQIVDGFISKKEVVIDEKKASNVMKGILVGKPESMENPPKTIKPDDRFSSRYDDEYDELGRRKLRRVFFSDGSMNSITHYSYDSTGAREKEVYNSFGNKWTSVYSLDRSGNPKSESMKRSNVKDVVDMIERTEYSDYKFDSNGNWIQRKYKSYREYDGKTSVSEGIFYRDIKY